MAFGIFELFISRLSSLVSFIARYANSFSRLFVKNLSGPEQVTFFVTDRCNLNCEHCFVDKTDAHPDKELSAGEIAKISEGMGRINYVTITGGEPFLRDDITDIVRILDKNLNPSLITILTNGLLTDKISAKMREIMDACRNSDVLVKISIDGPRQVHDKMRLRDGSFDSARTTFLKLKELKGYTGT